jgi:hypothetical protein
MNRCTADETITRATEFTLSIGNRDRQDSKLWIKQCSHGALGPQNIGNWLPEIDLWCFVHNPRIH